MVCQACQGTVVPNCRAFSIYCPTLTDHLFIYLFAYHPYKSLRRPDRLRDMAETAKPPNVHNQTTDQEVGAIVVDHLLLRFSMSPSIREIFRHIRGRYLKLSKIAPNFGRLLPSRILRGSSPKKVVCTQIIMPAMRHVTWKSFMKLLPLAPKL